MPSQLHVLCETKAQVMTEADVEQGWCLGWGERNASPVFLSLPSFGMAELSAGHLQVVLQCCFGLFPRGQGWSCGARGSEMSWVGSVPRGYVGLGLHHSCRWWSCVCFNSGSHLGRPDLLPRTLPVDEANSDSVATTLSTSSLGSGGLHSPANR